VAKFTLGKSPLLGSGLGGHEEMYYRRFANTAFQANYYYGLNAKAAHSLSIRILSELGLVGSALYLYTLVKSVLFARRGIHYAISLGCLSHFLCKFFKLGGYIDYGTPFFFTILLLNARGSFASQSQKSAAPRERHRVVPVQPAS
jgi:O-antigen ligase